MKFINQNGELQEGVALSDDQVKQRTEIVEFLHKSVCNGSYHSAYDRRNNTPRCEEVANFFVTKFTLLPLDGTDIAAEGHKYDPQVTAEKVEAE